jgi:hypothetical protein
MATVCHRGTGRVSASFAGVAKHYAVSVAICPTRSGHRNGVVEKINQTVAQRWWRTLGDDLTVEQAQVSPDTFASTRDDTRLRVSRTVGPCQGGSTSAAPLRLAIVSIDAQFSLEGGCDTWVWWKGFPRPRRVCSGRATRSPAKLGDQCECLA